LYISQYELARKVSMLELWAMSFRPVQRKR
jgi:hypothetical protein